jgi:hypothetical protein
MINLPEKLIFPVPFAGGEGSELTPIALEQIADATDAAKVNFFDGFPSSYSAPHENGGNFVTRGQLNAIGNLASKNEYFRMCGGINTFDPVFAQKIGGYPKDAILDYFDGVNLFKVISLEENNMADFRSGVFGGKWAKLGTNDVLQGSVIVGSIEGIYTWSPYDVYNIGIYIAPKSGIINIQQRSLSISDTVQNTSTNKMLSGCGILCRVFDTPDDVVYPIRTSSTEFDYKNYSQISTFPSLNQIDPIAAPNKYTILNLKRTPVEVKNGQLISICLQNGGYVDPYAVSTNFRSTITLAAGVYIN